MRAIRLRTSRPRRGLAATVTAVAAATAAACSVVVAPEESSSIQAIVVTAPASFQDMLERVNRVHIRVTRPGGPPRDTILQPRIRDGTVRARAILRPDEGDPGTLVDIDLKADAAFLFRGSVVVGAGSGWPFAVRIPVAPVGTFDAGPDRFLVLGERVELTESAAIVLEGGERRTPANVAWLTSDSSVVGIEAGEAVARTAGRADVLGVWYGQVDTLVFNVISGIGSEH